MTNHNANNERIKRQYFSFLEEARRYSVPSVDEAAMALARFEGYTKHRDFKAFNRDQAVAFKKHLANQSSRVTDGKLSKATRYSTLRHLKRFFEWLGGQPGYKSRLRHTDAEYFNLSEKDSRVATARRQRPAPTLEQVKYVLAQMPHATDVERRNRALVAFVLLTGARDGAVASTKLKHVDLAAGSVFQDAREVKTKFSKSFTTYFFPVGDEVRAIVEEWVTYLRTERLWGSDDPLFPATRMALGPTAQFQAAGLERTHWSNATPIRSVFREAFTRAGLPYFNPHSLRKTLVQLGEEACRSPEEFKAWSQNLGHEQVLTTFMSYGEVSPRRQGEIIHGLAASGTQASAEVSEDLVRAVLRGMKATGIQLR